jgi:hypothetical protein
MSDLERQPAAPVPGAATADIDEASRQDRYQWLALSVVLVGTVMVSLDTTIVNVALPVIRDDLH